MKHITSEEILSFACIQQTPLSDNYCCPQLAWESPLNSRHITKIPRLSGEQWTNLRKILQGLQQSDHNHNW